MTRVAIGTYTDIGVEAVLIEAVGCFEGVVNCAAFLDLGEEFPEPLRAVRIIQVFDKAPRLAVEEVYRRGVTRRGGELAHGKDVTAPDRLIDGVTEAAGVVLAIDSGPFVKPGR